MRWAALVLALIAPVWALPPAGAQMVVTCQDLAPPVTGTADDDVLHGTPGRDVVAGLGGDDVLRGPGGEGRDVVCGNGGTDTCDAERARGCER